MVIFQMKDSPLLCEIQLIIKSGSKEDKKEKNREILNHFLYELERSIFGVQGELSILLNFKDNKISYEKNINYRSSIDFSKCEETHP